MIPFAIPAFLANLPGWAKTAGIALAVALVCLPLGYCQGRSHEAARQDAARAIANEKSIQTDGRAKEISANERLTDATLRSEETKELIDAISDLPDTMPDSHRVQLGCSELRQAGRSEATLPVVCRPESPAAPAAH